MAFLTKALQVRVETGARYLGGGLEMIFWNGVEAVGFGFKRAETVFFINQNFFFPPGGDSTDLYGNMR